MPADREGCASIYEACRSLFTGDCAPPLDITQIHSIIRANSEKFTPFFTNVTRPGSQKRKARKQSSKQSNEQQSAKLSREFKFFCSRVHWMSQNGLFEDGQKAQAWFENGYRRSRVLRSHTLALRDQAPVDPQAVSSGSFTAIDQNALANPPPVTSGGFTAINGASAPAGSIAALGLGHYNDRGIEQPTEMGDVPQGKKRKLNGGRSGFQLPEWQLPFKVQHLVTKMLQEKLEVAAFEFGQQNFPLVMQNKQWDCAEAVELHEWAKVIEKKFNLVPLPGHSAPLSAMFQKTVLRDLEQLRHMAVHRLRLPVERVIAILQSAKTVTEALADNETTGLLEPIIRELQDFITRGKACIKDRQSTLNKELKQIEAERQALMDRERVAQSNAADNVVADKVAMGKEFDTAVRRILADTGLTKAKEKDGELTSKDQVKPKGRSTDAKTIEDRFMYSPPSNEHDDDSGSDIEILEHNILGVPRPPNGASQDPPGNFGSASKNMPILLGVDGNGQSLEHKYNNGIYSAGPDNQAKGEDKNAADEYVNCNLQDTYGEDDDMADEIEDIAGEGDNIHVADHDVDAMAG
ncbi:MAG: hypothetical protein M1831_006726 [Alyxoria varia]|nr:MAG: hypothetical protein M1831_006726 [Alyxoria varia]